MNRIGMIKVMQASVQQKQSGMLLIEVLFSILIFSFGILGLVGMQAISTKNAMTAEDRTIAAGLANDMVAQMWLWKTTNLTIAPTPPAVTNLSTDYTAWKNKVKATPGWINASGSVSTDATTLLTTVTVNWSTAATSKASGASTSPVAHQYVTSFSM